MDKILTYSELIALAAQAQDNLKKIQSHYQEVEKTKIYEEDKGEPYELQQLAGWIIQDIQIIVDKTTEREQTEIQKLNDDIIKLILG